MPVYNMYNKINAIFKKYIHVPGNEYKIHVQVLYMLKENVQKLIEVEVEVHVYMYSYKQ